MILCDDNGEIYDDLQIYRLQNILTKGVKTMRASLLGLIFFLMSFAGYSAEPDRYVLTNPSFETEAVKGNPTGWESKSSYYSLSFAESRTGNASLCWKDTGRDYEFCSQKTNLRPGDVVEFSVWAKTKDLKKGHAQICMEWKNQQGQNEGAYTVSSVTGTTKDWTKIGGVAVIPPHAHDIFLRCFASDGATGTVWFDDAELRHAEFDFFSGMTTDHYRHLVTAEPIIVKVGVSASTEGLEIQKLDARLSLRKYTEKKSEQSSLITEKNRQIAEDSSEIVLKDLVPEKRGKDWLQFRVNAQALTPGKYRAICRAQNPSNGKWEQIALTITRLEKMPSFRSYIDKNLRLVLNGQPFFPLGIYIITPEEKDIDQISAAGFNCLLPYAAIDVKTLDYIHSKDLKVVYSLQNKIPGPKHPEKKPAFDKAINELKQHPAIMAWYINDEIPLSRLPELIDRRQLFETADPSRPTLTVLCQSNEIRYYLPSLDVVGTDPYPIPKKPAFVAADWTARTVDGAMNCHAVWQVPQLFNWAAHRNDPKIKKEYRAPNYQEIRGMSWLCIANGANGLLYYSWHSLKHMDKTIADGGQALVREPFEDRWKDVTRMTQEIASWIPVLLKPQSSLKIEPNAQNDPQILWRSFGDKDENWLLIANGSPKMQKAEFTLPEGVKARESDLAPASFEQKGRTVTVTLSGLQPCFVHLQ